MASREEFAAFIRSDQQGWARQAQGSPGRTPRPPQAPKSGEQAPLLPPMPQSALPPPVSSASSGSRSKSPRPKLHGRSQSDFGFAAPLDPAHPFSNSKQRHTVHLPGVGGNRSSRPPRAGMQHSMIPPPPPTTVISPLSIGHGPAGGTTPRKSLSHRRIKSDIPLALYGGGGSILSGGGRLITKSDLLKNLPSPRWAPIRPLTHSRSNSIGDARSRAGSGDGRSRAGSVEHLLSSDLGSVSSGGHLSGGYGAISSDVNEGNPLLQSIGSVQMSQGPRRHSRMMSDASAMSVTTDLAKSALFKGVTDTGRIRMQLPKDTFRILMDCQLETGYVYKRKLVDDEDEFFVEFHTVNDLDDIDSLSDMNKRLPPDLYVMAVDSTIYRRMLDEVIASKSMPCGMFFCGHHEDVRHPDITIAAVIVGMVFLVLIAGVMWAPSS